MSYKRQETQRKILFDISHILTHNAPAVVNFKKEKH